MASGAVGAAGLRADQAPIEGESSAALRGAPGLDGAAPLEPLDRFAQGGHLALEPEQAFLGPADRGVAAGVALLRRHGVGGSGARLLVEHRCPTVAADPSTAPGSTSLRASPSACS